MKTAGASLSEAEAAEPLLRLDHRGGLRTLSARAFTAELGQNPCVVTRPDVPGNSRVRSQYGAAFMAFLLPYNIAMEGCHVTKPM